MIANNDLDHIQHGCGFVRMDLLPRYSASCICNVPASIQAALPMTVRTSRAAGRQGHSFQ